MTRATILFFFCISSLNALHAQKNRTYLGHKNLLEVNYTAHFPLFDENPYYEYENESLVLKKRTTKLQHGLQVAFMRHLSGNTSFGIEFDYYKNVYGPSSITAYSDGQYSHHKFEKIDVNCMAFIGKFEFGRRQGIFPLGLSHQVGAGYVVLTPTKQEGTVHAESSNYYYGTTSSLLVDYKIEGAKGVTAFYNMNFRVALSNRLLLNFGARYHFTYVFRSPSLVSGTLNDEDFSLDLRKRVGWNIMRLYTGLAYSF